MRAKEVFAILATLLAATAQEALADPDYKAADILRHFAPQPPFEKPNGGLGQPRKLCLGTEGTCGAGVQEQSARKAEAFDLVVTFDYNSDVLTKQARENLDEFSKALKDPQLASSSFLIEGHTDARGSETYNMALSERRAAAVVRYLADKGIEPNKLDARGLGKAKPRAKDPFSPENRRVETRIRME